MGLKSESTGGKYKKMENIWNAYSDNTGAFPELNNIDKNDIYGASRTQLVTSLHIFSTWMISQLKKVLYVQKKLRWSLEFMLKTIGTFCVMLERKNILLPIIY